MLQTSRSVAHLGKKVNEMNNRNELIRSFRQARIAGEQLLSQGKISWDQFQFTMIGFELTLQEMGEDL
jgi:hypothetical protein